MKTGQKVRWAIWFFFILLFAGIVVLNTSGPDAVQSVVPETNTILEIFNKIFVGSLLLLSFLLFLIVPKTGFSKKMRPTERSYNLYCIVGMICGFCGLIATLLWPHWIIKTHLMWAIVMPWVLMNFYYATIQVVQKSNEFGDEKQELNMSSAAALTMGFTIPVMVVIFLFYENNILQGSLWFPYYFFTTIFVFSAMTLHLFKNE
ncbi:hypothetical protein JW935_08880 [candidate division KSB1 bacterium]|nr:hypothetical protein [candidate division KSB1 bacterium]